MPSFGGLISGVLGSAAKGVGDVAERELVKNAQLDLRKQMAEAEDAMAQRVEERRRMAGITEEERKMSPEYISKVGAADLARGKLTAQNQAALATDIVAAEKAKVKALTDSGLSEDKAKLEAADWAAGEKNRLAKAAEATTAKKTEVTTLAGDKGYLKGLSDIDVAGKAGDIAVAEKRNIFRGQGGGDKASVVRRVMTDAAGNAVAVMSDGSIKDLGMKGSDYDRKIADIQLKMEKENPKFAKEPAAKKRAIAEQVLTGKVPPSSAPSANRPPIGTFKQQ
jgi:hypothetical protein